MIDGKMKIEVFYTSLKDKTIGLQDTEYTVRIYLYLCIHIICIFSNKVYLKTRTDENQSQRGCT